MVQIRRGFTGQRLVLFPFGVVDRALRAPLISDLVLHSMGYFPKAIDHFVDRRSGCGEYILIYCAKGEGWFFLNGERHIVPENHFFILPSEVPHQYGSSKSNPWYIYWAHFKGTKATYISKQLQGVIPIDVDNHSRINDRLAFFDELLNVMESGVNEDVVNYASLSFNHLISSFLYIKTYREAKYVQQKSTNSFFVSKAIHYMYENIEKRLTLKEMAAMFYYSESYFYRLFFKETQYAPINYFLHLKVERACQLLLHTNLKINQIALKLGFEDPYYFSRIFKKINGKSPKEYRLSANQNP